MHKLAVVGISGVVICAACLGAGAAIGVRALHESGIDFGHFGEGRACDFSPSGTDGSRSIAWTGGDSVAIAVPAEIHYQRGMGDQVVITGDNSVLPHIHIQDSTIKLDCRWRNDNDDITVTLPGRLFKGFKIAGAGKLTLDNIDQPDLSISIAGAGEVDASGKTGNLDLHMAGAGEAKLGALAADSVKVHMAGANHAEISPKDDLNAHIAGIGDIKLLTEPAKIENRFAGIGNIIHPNERD